MTKINLVIMFVVVVFGIFMYFFVWSQNVDIEYINGGSLPNDKFDDFDLDYTFSTLKEIKSIDYCVGNEGDPKVSIKYRYPVDSYTSAIVTDLKFKYIEIGGLKNFNGIKSIIIYPKFIIFEQNDNLFCGVKE